MADVGRHPRIKLMTLSEVENVSGYIGNFKVKVRRKARYVNEAECTACGDCASVCPVLKTDEYQVGLATRKAVYMPFPQAIPAAYVVNMKDCLGNNPIACNKCVEKCEKKCINLDARDEIVELSVGAIIVATGMDVYDPTALDEYGYTRFANVVTSLEFERLINAGGPTDGNLVRPGDGKSPKRIGFIQCVGSRTQNRGNPYCSNICCMNTIKDSLLLKEHYPDTEIYVYYIDIRAFGKGFEDLYNRSKQMGVKYIRGLPGEITEDAKTGNLRLKVENTTTGRIEDYELDMVVLAVGLEPPKDGDKLRHQLALSKTSDGFLAERHAKLMPVDTATRGIFLAGCAEAPKDIKDSVTQASAAAARAEIILKADRIKLDAAKAVVDQSKCTMCEMCVKVCPYGAITASRAQKKPAEVIEAMCAGCSSCAAECAFDAITIRHFDDAEYLAQIDAALKENPQEKLLTFACNWCSYAASDLTGSSRLQYPSSVRIVRTMCSARVNEKFILQAFALGAPIVLVSGCHFADCHYNGANRATQRRIDRLWDKLERLGIRPERLQLEWMSAAEGQRFAKVMAELDEMRKKVTAEEIEETKKILAAQDGKKKKTAAPAAA
ncbi:MAG: hydrogenase iron-sulfur subunit [Dehalococcoidales bacterium]|nr:hydrogenase iron-sulfur subunit [Dehalococcoidales bacterium]